MPDLAQLNLVIDSQQVPQAQQRMDSLTKSGTANEQMVQRLENQFTALAGSLKTVQGAFTITSQAMTSNQNAMSSALASSARQMELLQLNQSNYNRGANEAGESTGFLSSKLNQALAAVTALGLGFLTFEGAKRILETAAGIEKMNVSLVAVFGSAEAAQKILAEMSDLAEHSPFEKMGLLEAAKQMHAMGIEAEKIPGIMKGIVDATAAVGKGQEYVDSITTAFGRMKSRGEITTFEMRQLVSAGIPGWELLAKAIGTDVPTAMELARKKMIDVGAAIDGIVDQLEIKYGGMAEVMTHTVGGAMDQLAKKSEESFRAISTAITDSLHVKGILDELNRLIGTTHTVADVIRSAFGDNNGATTSIVAMGAALRALLIILALLAVAEFWALLAKLPALFIGLANSIGLCEVSLTGFMLLLESNPATVWLIAIGALIALGVSLYETFHKESQETTAVKDSMESATVSADKYADALNRVKAAKGQQIDLTHNQADMLKVEIQGYKDADAAIKQEYNALKEIQAQGVSRIPLDVVRKTPFNNFDPEHLLPTDDNASSIDPMANFTKLGIAAPVLSKSYTETTHPNPNAPKDEITTRYVALADVLKTLEKQSDTTQTAITGLNKAVAAPPVVTITAQYDELVKKLGEVRDAAVSKAKFGDDPDSQAQALAAKTNKELDDLINTKGAKVPADQTAAMRAQTKAILDQVAAAEAQSKFTKLGDEEEKSYSDEITKVTDSLDEKIAALKLEQDMMAKGVSLSGVAAENARTEAQAQKEAAKAGEDDAKAILDKAHALETLNTSVGKQKDATTAQTQLGDQMSKLNDEYELLGKTDDERDRASKLIEVMRLATKAYGDDQEKVNAIVAEFNQRLKDIQDRKDMIKLGNDLGQAFANSFTEAITSGNKLIDVLRNLAKSVEQILTKQLVADPLAKALSGGFQGAGSFLHLPGFGGGNTSGTPGIPGAPSSGGDDGSNVDSNLTPDDVSNLDSDGLSFDDASAFSLGGVFGTVKRYASGDIFGQATAFRHAGGLGVLGEDGPEAIMPLKRGSDGKLGISGGGSVVHNHQWNIKTQDADSFRRSQAQVAGYAQRSVGPRRQG